MLPDIPAEEGFSHAAVSQAFGYLSVFCWFVVFLPQIYENYKRKSGESLSMTFLLIWIVGDVLNLAGVFLQDLLFTMLVLSIYYCASDAVLLAQIYYYKYTYPTPTTPDLTPDIPASESAPLLPSAATAVVHERSTRRSVRSVLYILLPAILVLGLFIAFHEHVFEARIGTLLRRHHHKRPEPTPEYPGHFLLWPQLLGWISAALYIAARIPQIIKNYQSRSCEGLSLAMFAFCVLGNITFCASILTFSLEPSFILINLPWLIGNGGTLFFDFIIFYQFWKYSPPKGEVVCPEDVARCSNV